MQSVMRFQIFSGARDKMYKCDTLQQAIDWLLTRDMGLEEFWVEDLKDDIEVNADDILAAYREGERYEDLQGF